MKSVTLSGLLVFIAINVYATYPPVPANAVYHSICGMFCEETADIWVWEEGGWLYLHASPSNGHMPLCGLSFTVIQNSMQYGDLDLESEIYEDFCDDLYTPITFRVVCGSFAPTCFDANSNLKLVFDGSVDVEFDVTPGTVQSPQPQSGWWWNPAEDGRGYNIEIQGNKLFMAWYAYDQATGQPCWFSSGGQMTDSAHYSGQLWKYMNGQCVGCPYTAPDSALLPKNWTI